MTKIFISHSSKDTEFAMQLAEALTEVGINVWIDVASIRAGEKWNNAIHRGLNECETMIVIITPDSMASDNVGDEWLYYHQRGKKIFTVLWKPTDDIHFQLEPIQYVKFHGKDFVEAFVELRTELGRQGVVIDDGQGRMHEIRSDAATPPPTPPRIQGGENTALPRVEDILPPPFEWVEIPGGTVILEDERSNGGTSGGIFKIDDFSIAKYPITNAQYQIFLDAQDGYADAHWWSYSDEAKTWRSANLQPKAPVPGTFADYPRANLIWYDAVSFCRWLTWTTTSQISLPTEQQWQRAAVGDTKWIYPWGNEFDSAKCNTHESQIGRVTSVRRYPQGASPYGVMDLSGNVVEWCLNDWETGETNSRKYAKERCGRGGSFYDDQLYARATCRNSWEPDSGSRSRGFRIVAMAGLGA